MGLKYYFGYIQRNGKEYPVRWMEENDTAVGGKVDYVGERTEVAYEVYDRLSLAGLASMYPFKEKG